MLDRNYTHSYAVSLTDSVVSGNVAQCLQCSGGGVYLSTGGLLTLTSTAIVNNSATQFGGGMYLGLGDSFGSKSTCGLVMDGCTISDNAAGQAGAQLYSTCLGNVVVVNTTVDMTDVGTQVGFPSGHMVNKLCGCASMRGEHVPPHVSATHLKHLPFYPLA